MRITLEQALKPTQAQLEMIDAIEIRCGYAFEGKTKQEAYEFITKHIDDLNFQDELDGIVVASLND